MKMFSMFFALILSALPALADTTSSSISWGVDAAEFKDLSTALSSPATEGKTVFVTKPMVINDKVTDRALQVVKGGLITVNAGKTFVVNGPFTAGRHQVFSGQGTVRLPKASESHAEWFGIKGDGSDESEVIQKTINALTAGEARFPAGTFKGNAVMKTEVTVSGVTSGLTFFRPAVDAPVFSISQATSNVRFGWKNLTIDGSATKAAFKNQDGISIVPGPGKWADTITVEDVVIQNCGRYGWHSYGSSSMGPFIQRLVMTKFIAINNTREGIFLDGNHFETNFRDVWATQNGDKTTYANARIGNRGAPNHSASRLNWVGGGITQTTLNTRSRMIKDAAMTAGGNTLTSDSASFTPDDVGTPVVIALSDAPKPAFITTISAVSNKKTALLAANAPENVTAGTAIINTPITGGLHISHAAEVNITGVEFEECGAYVIIDGSLTHSINIFGSSFISNKPAMAAIWLQGSMPGRIHLQGWSLYSTEPVLWGALASTPSGGHNGAISGLDIEPPFNNGQIVYGLTSLYDYEFPAAGVVAFKRTEMPHLRVFSGSGPLRTITGTYNQTTALRQGQAVTLTAFGQRPLLVEHGTGNILLASPDNFEMPITGSSSSSLTLMWDGRLQKWIETSRSNRVSLSPYTNKTGTRRDLTHGATLSETVDVLGTLISDLKRLNLLK